MDTDPGEFETTLKLCSSKHRRIILGILVREQRALTLNDLMKEIVKRNHHAAITDVPSRTVNQIYLSLCHQHVPKLADANVVTYENDRQLLEPTERLERMQPYLSAIFEIDPELDRTDTD
ncbi:DUF7344 domain-containing protein [Natronorubrum halophilum]|uniref:DUF7344 domain-containing protein n=1 Tax=Natronorubrum halophilum TaxID=1702106 RepID=UPI000EF73D3E|nr:hypothetical protein [Natronorubrum halophilum]